MSPNLDNQVILAFSKGEHAAFQRVFEAIYPKLLDFAYRFIGNSLEAEDIALLAFHKLFENCSKFESEINIKAFLYTSVRNRCINYLRNQKTRLHIQIDIAEQLQSDLSLSYEYEIRDVLYEKVQAAIEELPGECKKIFKMLFIEDLTPTEVAEILKIKTSTVYNQKRNALKALRFTLGEHSLALAFIIHILATAQDRVTTI